MDMTKDRKAAKLVRDALALMNDEGRHWTRGSMHRKTPVFNKKRGQYESIDTYCAVGALRQVAFGVADAPPSEHPNLPVYRQAVKAIASIVRPKATPGYETDYVINWNDSGGRRFQDIKETFLAAARNLKSA